MSEHDAQGRFVTQNIRLSMNDDGIARLFVTQEALDELVDAAKVIEDNIKSIAPVTTGAYRDSWSSGEGPMVGGKVCARVATTDRSWHLVEYGSVTQSPERIAFTAVEMARLKFVDDAG